MGSSFFKSGTVDTSVINRDKLPCLEGASPDDAQQAVYRVRFNDFADYIGATKGDRSQVNFEVVEGILPAGTKGSHVVMHGGHDAAWKIAKARGEIAAMLGAFLGLTRDASGLKVTGEVFDEHTRVVQQNPETGKTISATRSSDELPLAQKGAEAYLVVAPYFDKKTKKRRFNPKTRMPSVTYELYPLSAKMFVTTEAPEVSGEFDVGQFSGDETPDAPETTVDALEAAITDGWKPNPKAPGFFYRKGEPKQLKEPALRAMYGG